MEGSKSVRHAPHGTLLPCALRTGSIVTGRPCVRPDLAGRSPHGVPIAPKRFPGSEAELMLRRGMFQFLEGELLRQHDWDDDTDWIASFDRRRLRQLQQKI